MKLTKEEQRMFDGEMGDAARESMEILAALGRIYGAEKMIPGHERAGFRRIV